MRHEHRLALADGLVVWLVEVNQPVGDDARKQCPTELADSEGPDLRQRQVLHLLRGGHRTGAICTRPVRRGCSSVHATGRWLDCVSAIFITRIAHGNLLVECLISRPAIGRRIAGHDLSIYCTRYEHVRKPLCVADAKSETHTNSEEHAGHRTARIAWLVINQTGTSRMPKRQFV